MQLITAHSLPVVEVAPHLKGSLKRLHSLTSCYSPQSAPLTGVCCCTFGPATEDPAQELVVLLVSHEQSARDLVLQCNPPASPYLLLRGRLHRLRLLSELPQFDLSHCVALCNGRSDAKTDPAPQQPSSPQSRQQRVESKSPLSSTLECPSKQYEAVNLGEVNATSIPRCYHALDASGPPCYVLPRREEPSYDASVVLKPLEAKSDLVFLTRPNHLAPQYRQCSMFALTPLESFKTLRLQLREALLALLFSDVSGVQLARS
ncbi:hypothetical protein PR003_g4219 [Phytophthora rubi]|uniref:Uncharacterized protein n=1 Tax=Phytophthora rubi TaxID=129364 RepID=A0A6A4FWM2_9STRA|nr:hypothetical protein PR003_g4219 [Phytophthora rubi]